MSKREKFLLKHQKIQLNTDLKIILFIRENNYRKHLNNVEKTFNILATSSSVLHNYFDLTKSFSDLYPVEFLDALAKNRSFRVGLHLERKMRERILSGFLTTRNKPSKLLTLSRGPTSGPHIPFFFF